MQSIEIIVYLEYRTGSCVRVNRGLQCEYGRRKRQWIGLERLDQSRENHLAQDPVDTTSDNWEEKDRW